MKILQFFLFFSLLVLVENISFGQSSRPVIQLSGIIVGEDSTSGVPGVHVYVPRAGRGTSTNIYGYFSMPVLAGDSVVISSVGYVNQHYKVPANQGENITIIVELVTDTTFLNEVQIFPYPTEQLFKQAILAMNLPINEYEQSPTLGPEVLARMLQNSTFDASTNYKYYTEQQFNRLHLKNTYQNAQTALLNPFAWANFIQSIKNGDFKKKK
ncbi:MAG: carboxypeptidase-like regulatory domain-containing protein [Bacteroidota bacterium]